MKIMRKAMDEKMKCKIWMQFRHQPNTDRFQLDSDSGWLRLSTTPTRVETTGYDYAGADNQSRVGVVSAL